MLPQETSRGGAYLSVSLTVGSDTKRGRITVNTRTWEKMQQQLRALLDDSEAPPPILENPI